MDLENQGLVPKESDDLKENDFDLDEQFGDN